MYLPIEVLLRKHAYKQGTFTLANGTTSNEYLDVKNAILHFEAGHQLAFAVAEGIRYSCGAVAGPVLGGAMLALRVATLLFMPCLPVRTEVKTHGRQQLIEGLDNLPPADLLNPDRVWLIEDVITSGGTTIKAMEYLRAANLWVAGITAVVDREQGGLEAIHKHCPGLPVKVLTTLSKVRAAG